MNYTRQVISNLIVLILLTGGTTKCVNAQIPNPVLIGYFHNWNDANAPYISLDQVDARYKIIDVSFAIPKAGTDYNMEFVPDQVSQATFISQMQTLQSQGRKVLISMGGATAPISLSNVAERDTFVSSMTNIINTFGFDGIDIDFEGSSLSVSGGTISNPTDQPIIHLVSAVKQIMSNYQTTHNKKLILTMAPETAFVQGGQSAYAGIWGAYLPVIHGLRDSLDILHVQLYNSGTMYGIDNNVYTQGTADFIVAMCEAVIKGFSTAGGSFVGLPASKVAAGLPACASAAGGGYCHPDTVKAAINYLRGAGPAPGSYTLATAGGYPSFGGLMTWSINWDAVASCSSSYSFANLFTSIYGTPNVIESEVESNKLSWELYPNPTSETVNVKLSFSSQNSEKVVIYNILGQEVLTQTILGEVSAINISHLNAGIYMVEIAGKKQKIVKY